MIRLECELGFMIRRYAILLNERQAREIAEGLFLCDDTCGQLLSALVFRGRYCSCGSASICFDFGMQAKSFAPMRWRGLSPGSFLGKNHLQKSPFSGVSAKNALVLLSFRFQHPLCRARREFASELFLSFILPGRDCGASVKTQSERIVNFPDCRLSLPCDSPGWKARSILRSRAPSRFAAFNLLPACSERISFPCSSITR